MTKNRTPTPVYLDPGMHSGLEVKGLTFRLYKLHQNDNIGAAVSLLSTFEQVRVVMATVMVTFQQYKNGI